MFQCHTIMLTSLYPIHLLIHLPTVFIFALYSWDNFRENCFEYFPLTNWTCRYFQGLWAELIHASKLCDCSYLCAAWKVWVYGLFPWSAPLRTWFDTWSQSKPAWESLAGGATTCTSISRVSAWARAASSFLHKYLGRRFSETQGYLYRGDHMGASRRKIRFHTRYCSSTQLKPSLLCREASSLGCLQPDHSSSLALRKGKGGHLRWVWDLAWRQGRRARIWVRCGSRGGSQRGFSGAWERRGEEGQESLACPETNAGWSWSVSLSRQLFPSWMARGRSSEGIILGFLSEHCEITHGNSPLDPTVLSIFSCKGGGLALCRKNVMGCYAGRRLCLLFMLS